MRSHPSPTPVLDRRLAGLRRRLVVKVWQHGLGTVLGAACLWLAFAYLADWGLRVPRAVRVLHGLTFLGVVGFFVWRDLLRPLRRIPGRSGLALLLEREDPDLHELLVSAVQLQGRVEPGQDPVLVERVLAEAERRAGALPRAAVIDDRPPRTRLLLGAGLAATLLFAALSHPLQAGIFLDRLAGGTRPWPQRTHLALVVPDLGPGAVVTVDGQPLPREGSEPPAERAERRGQRVSLRVARGSDLPVLVRAEGLQPDRVTLHFEGGRDLELQPAGAGLYRTLLRALQEDVRFTVTGGDDTDGLPRAEIEVLRPPDVEGLAIVVEPPAYSGLATATYENRDVEVLASSKVRVHVRPFPPDARGVARLFPAEGQAPIVLERAPYPIAVDGDSPAGLAFELTAERTVGFRIELADETGLENPDPGLFRIEVVEDRAPELRVLSPARTDFEIVAGGAIPLRARAEDDFGVVAMNYEIHARDADGEELPIAAGALELRALEAPRDAADPSAEDDTPRGQRALALGTTRLEVLDLDRPELPLAVDQRYEFVFTAEDTRAPEPGVGRTHVLRARVVTPEELLRRMQDRLAQARLTAVRLTDLQRDKRRRVEELLSALEGDGADDAERGAVAAALTGQRRVRVDALGLARELGVVLEDVLYARLDPKAGALLEFYDARQRDLSDLRYHAEPIRALAAALAEGSLPPSGFATNLVQLTELSLQVSEDHARLAAEAIEEADKALARADKSRALGRALEQQLLAEDRLEALLEELAEWDNFQNVLALTRDILNRQKALRQRTQQFASEK